jgi:hypothetical protein
MSAQLKDSILERIPLEKKQSDDFTYALQTKRWCDKREVIDRGIKFEERKFAMSKRMYF